MTNKNKNWEEEEKIEEIIKEFYREFVNGSVQRMEDEYANCYALPFDFPEELESWLRVKLQSLTPKSKFREMVEETFDTMIKYMKEDNIIPKTIHEDSIQGVKKDLIKKIDE